MVSTGITVLALVCFAGPYDQASSTQLTIEPDLRITEETGGTANEDDSAPSRRLTMRQKRLFVLGLAASQEK